jgi:phospholipid transport system substrate-binding protein
MKKIILLLCALSLGLINLARADDEQPDVLVKNAVQEVIAAIKQDKGKAEPKKLMVVVDSQVLPLFDFTLMTKRAVGPAWKSATLEQKAKVVDEFRALLIRAYISSKLVALGDQQVVFEPMKLAANDDQVDIKMLTTKSGEAAQDIIFTMKKTAAGWRVTDVKIFGAFVAKGVYSSQFEEQIKQGGMDGLLKWLVDKNLAGNAKTTVHKVDAK